MKTFVHQLYDYNFYCNKTLIASLGAMEKISDRSQKLMGHILNAHHIWNARIQGAVPSFEVWQQHPQKDWADIHYENQRTTFDIVEGTVDLHKRIDYVNSKGSAHTNTILDILYHVVNHSTHHRGQILMDMRENGAEPPILDYIFFKR